MAPAPRAQSNASGTYEDGHATEFENNTYTPQLTYSLKYASLKRAFGCANMSGAYNVMGLFHLNTFSFCPWPIAFELHVAHLSKLFTALTIRYSALVAHGTDTPGTSRAFAAIPACVITQWWKC